MLRGLTTLTYLADNVAAATRWYAEVLGAEPYFVRPEQGDPMYTEFRIGDHQHELGIMDRRFAGQEQASGPQGAFAYWHVDDLEAAVERLVSLGATVHQPPTERGPGFVTASVVDPFGNLLGVMYNQHYLDVLA